MIEALNNNGYIIYNSLFSSYEVDGIINELKLSKTIGRNFAIRHFFLEVPTIQSLIFNKKFTTFFKSNFGSDYFLIKSIYFDKPPNANWVVPWHQDLTIVTDCKREINGFSKWRIKNGHHYVQPTKNYLESIITIRIHLDNCTAENGALKVIAGSHKKGIGQKLDIEKEKTIICEVNKGGALVMKPLVYHASKRTENNQKRRVIHLEFASIELPFGLDYPERINF